MSNLTKFIRESIRHALSENVVLDIMKNKESAPNMGSTYGQDVEPSGTYVSHGTSRLPNYVNGKADLKNPLFIDIDSNSMIQYKRDLSTQYNAKGKRLTNKLMKLGYDSIITVFPDGRYGEIVLFPNSSFMLH